MSFGYNLNYGVMKKTIMILLFAFITLLTFAQTKDVTFNTDKNVDFIERAQIFIDETEKVYHEYSSENWNYSLRQFKEMNEEYRKIGSDISTEEKRSFAKLRGNYVGFAIQAGAEQVVESALKIIKSLSPFFEGLKESFKSSADSVRPSGQTFL
jgi:hypothetical protein